MASIDHLWNKKHFSKYTSRGYNGRNDRLIGGEPIKIRKAHHVPLLKLKLLWKKHKIRTAYDITYDRKEYST